MKKVKKSNPMLLLTINCSIGNKRNHLSIKRLCDLFLHIKEKKNSLTNLEKYAITTMQEEAKPQEIELFKQEYPHIPKENIDYALSINPYAK